MSSDTDKLIHAMSDAIEVAERCSEEVSPRTSITLANELREAVENIELMYLKRELTNLIRWISSYDPIYNNINPTLYLEWMSRKQQIEDQIKEIDQKRINKVIK